MTTLNEAIKEMSEFNTSFNKALDKCPHRIVTDGAVHCLIGKRKDDCLNNPCLDCKNINEAYLRPEGAKEE